MKYEAPPNIEQLSKKRPYSEITKRYDSDGEREEFDFPKPSMKFNPNEGKSDQGFIQGEEFSSIIVENLDLKRVN